MILTTLCYIKRGDSWLMLHRISKKDDVNAGKWIGVGGKLENGEAPEECLLREIREETGLVPESYSFRGMLTFIYESKEPEYIFVYTAVSETGTPSQCDEGVLQWIPVKKVPELELWEGDRFLIKYLAEDRKDPFSLRLSYDKNDRLVSAWELSCPPVRLK